MNNDTRSSGPGAAGTTDGERRLWVLLVDDHAMFRRGLARMIGDLAPEVEILEEEAAPHWLASFAADAGNAGPAPDLVLMEPWHSGECDVDHLREMRVAFPDSKLVVVSAHDSHAHVRAALEAGADGYIPKTVSSEVFLHALRLVLAGGTFLPPTILGIPEEAAPEPPARQGAQWMNESELCRLTPRQVEVVELLAAGMSNKEIARELALSVGTVKLHVTAVIHALGVSNRTQAVMRAAELGIIRAKGAPWSD